MDTPWAEAEFMRLVSHSVRLPRLRTQGFPALRKVPEAVEDRPLFGENVCSIDVGNCTVSKRRSGFGCTNSRLAV